MQLEVPTIDAGWQKFLEYWESRYASLWDVYINAETTPAQPSLQCSSAREEDKSCIVEAQLEIVRRERCTDTISVLWITNTASLKVTQWKLAQSFRACVAGSVCVTNMSKMSVCICIIFLHMLRVSVFVCAWCKCVYVWARVCILCRCIQVYTCGCVHDMYVYLHSPATILGTPCQHRVGPPFAFSAA